MTNVDAITGTPMYLAPEAIAAPDSVDARSDLYALGLGERGGTARVSPDNCWLAAVGRTSGASHPAGRM